MERHDRKLFARACRCDGREGYGIITLMTVQDIVNTDEYQSMVNDYRMQCLWFTDRGGNPENEIQLEQILNSIETYGDMNAFKRVGRIRKWLSQDSRPRYSGGLPVCA